MISKWNESEIWSASSHYFCTETGLQRCWSTSSKPGKITLDKKEKSYREEKDLPTPDP